MPFIRTILVALITISIAVLPAAGEAIVPPLPAAVTMADQADMPCCPACDSQSDIKATVCFLKCVALAGAILPAMTFALPYIPDGSPQTFVEDALHGLARAPPTHPPPA